MGPQHRIFRSTGRVCGSILKSLDSTSLLSTITDENFSYGPAYTESVPPTTMVLFIPTETFVFPLIKNEVGLLYSTQY